MDKLKPCPFCGENPELIDDKMRRQFYVICIQCSASSANWSTSNRAIKEWNTRSTPEQVKVPSVEEMKDVVLKKLWECVISPSYKQLDITVCAIHALLTAEKGK